MNVDYVLNVKGSITDKNIVSEQERHDMTQKLKKNLINREDDEEEKRMIDNKSREQKFDKTLE